MITESNVCGCAVCTGSECKCGCQNAAPRPTASCQCGEVCNCGEGCNCHREVEFEEVSCCHTL